MPYDIVEHDGKFCVQKRSGEIMKCYDTKEEARKYQSALYANVEKSMPEIKTEAEAIALGLPTFKFVAEMKAVPLFADGSKRVHLTASSNATDLVGDVMSEKALRRIQETAIGKTMFLNHDTTVPESVFGVIESAELVSRTVKVTAVGADRSFTEMPLLCLEYAVLVEESNPRAVKTWEIINNGKVQLGASVTIAVLDKTRHKDGRTVLEDVYHLETSVVGVPCNQTAWLERVTAKSFIHAAKRAARRTPAVAVEFGADVAAVELAEIDAKADWTSAHKNDLPDSCFLYIEPGGSKDEDGKTTPRSLRHFPYKDADGNIDLPHLRNALARIPQSSLPQDVKDRVAARARRIASNNGIDVGEKTMANDDCGCDEQTPAEVTEKSGRRNSSRDVDILEKCHAGAHALHASLVSLGLPCEGFTPDGESETEDEDQNIDHKSAAAVAEDVLPAVAEVERLAKEQLAEMELKVKNLEAENKNLTRERALWKARYRAAVTLAEQYANLPAERPGLPAN
jgi:hypothetical protein